MTVSTLTPEAWHAIKAAQMRLTCGPYASRRYAIKHGVLGLYRLACQLQSIV